MTVNRCLLVAAVALDLTTFNCGDVVRVPGATNGTNQAWDGLDQNAWVTLANPSITIYTTFASVPLALKKYLVRVLRYDDVTATVNVNTAWKRLADCTVLDFIKVVNATVPSVKTATTLIAGDRPVEWLEIHHWAGKVGDTLGAA